MGLLKRREMDMTTGPILKKIITYAIPLIVANLLQVAFNLADTLVLGMFAENGNNCVGAVSTTSAIINLCVALFIGLSVGSNVMVARNIGAKNQEGVKRTIGLSVFLSVFAGVVLLLVGVFFSRTFLELTGVSDVHIDLANKYLKIYLCGTPFIMLYNFCASVLRASGDTFRPMIYIMIGGVVNVILNIILVVFTPLDIEGVAIATVTSNAIAGICCLVTLLKSNSVVKFEWKYFRIFKKELIDLVKIGIPSGLQSCVFAFSNVLIASSMNELGKIYGAHVLSGSGYSGQIDNLIYMMMDAIALSAQVFVSQNLGAKNYDRIKKTLFTSVGLVASLGISLSGILVLLIKPIVLAISGDQLVAQAAFTRTIYVTIFYFLCGTMNTMSFSLRGLGESLISMLVVVFGNVVLRVIYILFIFPLNKTEATIYVLYPITWAITIGILAIFLVVILKKLKIKLMIENEFNQSSVTENCNQDNVA